MNTNRIAHLMPPSPPEPTTATANLKNPFAELNLSDDDMRHCGAVRVSLAVTRDEDEGNRGTSIAVAHAFQCAVNDALASVRENPGEGSPLAVRVDHIELYADAVKVEVTMLLKREES